MTQFRLSALAEEDLTAIWVYIGQYNEDLADSLIAQLGERFVMLSAFPNAGRSREDIRPDLRSFAIEKYVIFYRVIPEGVEIIRILHGSRDIEKAFSPEE